MTMFSIGKVAAYSVVGCALLLLPFLVSANQDETGTEQTTTVVKVTQEQPNQNKTVEVTINQHELSQAQADSRKKPAISQVTSIKSVNITIDKETGSLMLKGAADDVKQVEAIIKKGLGIANNMANPAYIPPASTAILQPGEVLSIESMNESSLNRRVVVQADSVLTLPFLGDVSVKGLTPGQATEKISEAYLQYVKNPELLIVRVAPQATSASQVVQASPNKIPRGSTEPIEPGEFLTIESPNEMISDRQIIVPADAVITVPFVGNVSVKGLTPEQASEKINELLNPYLKEPFVQIYRGALPKK